MDIKLTNGMPVKEWVASMKKAVKQYDNISIVELCNVADEINCKKYCAFNSYCHWLYGFTGEVPKEWITKFED